MNNNNIVKSLDQLAKMFGKDRLITPEEIDKVLAGIVSLLTAFKRDTEELNADTKATTEKLLETLLQKYEIQNKNFATTTEKQQQDFKDKVEEMIYLIQEFKKLKPQNGKDGVSPKLQDIIDGVLGQIKLPKPEQFVLHGEDIIDKINELDLSDENKIDWERIKNIPAWLFERPVGNGGMSPTVLRQAVDLDHSTRADGYAIVWDDTAKRHKYSASGGGGGSGTVNSGTQYRLAYYATTGTAVSNAGAITGARVLISDANGVPTHSAVTATTLGYLDATSSIQTQLDAKGTFTLPSLTAGSVLFSNGSTIAQDNANFFWDDTNNRLGIGTATPSRQLHIYGNTSGGHVLFERTTSATTGLAGTARFKATSTGDMADTFGAQIAFDIDDTAAVSNEIGVIAVLRNGADNTGYMAFYTANAGTDSQRMLLDHTSLRPATNDGIPLGTSTLMWSDLFLASGAVINFNNGDVTLTHSADTLTLGGGNLALGTNSITMTGSIGATGARVTKGWFTDIESTNMPTVGGTAILTSLTAPQFTTIELGHASDTTLARVSAGVVSIEGVTIDTISGANTLTNKTLTAPKFADLGFIADANGNELIIFDLIASAVNEITIGNATTGNKPFIVATGGDTNIGLDISSKGTGSVTLWSGNLARELLILPNVASAVNELTITGGATGTGVTVGASGGDSNIDLLLSPKGTGIVKGELKRFMVRLLDSTTALTTGTSKGGDYRISNRAITVKAVGMFLDTAATGGTLTTIDINEAGTTILSTKLTTDASEKSSETAATPPVISDSAIAADAIITFDIDAIGNTTAGNGLTVWIDYVYA